jgi:hypothetical protein
MSIHVDRKIKSDGKPETDTDIEIRKLKAALQEANKKLTEQDLRLARLEQKFRPKQLASK